MSDLGDNEAVGNVGGEGGGVQKSGQIGNPTERPKLPDSFISASIISTLLLSGLLLIKVYGVAHYNANVAVALASASPTSVVLGTIAVYSYFFIGMIATVSIFMFIYGSTYAGKSYMHLRPIFLFIALFMFLLTPWHYFVDGIVLTALLTVTQRLLAHIWGNIPENVRRRLGKSSGGSPDFDWLRACMASIVITFMLFILATLDQPWLPAESITLDQKITTDQTAMSKKLMSKQPVGFVIGEQNGWVEILIDDDRNIIFVPSADVMSHQICNLNTNPMGSSPILQLLSSETFSGHVLSCWRETDQLDEKQKKNAPLPIRLLEWCPKQYPHPKNHTRRCL